MLELLHTGLLLLADATIVHPASAITIAPKFEIAVVCADVDVNVPIEG